MYQYENRFDAYFERASNRTGLFVPLLKTVAALASSFDPSLYDFHSGRIGLMGLTLAMAQAMDKSIEGHTEVKEPERNILLSALYLRVILSQWTYFGIPEDEPPNYFDVITKYAERARTTRGGMRDFDTSKMKRVYEYFANKPGEPYSSLPREIPGTRQYGTL